MCLGLSPSRAALSFRLPIAEAILTGGSSFSYISPKTSLFKRSAVRACVYVYTEMPAISSFISGKPSNRHCSAIHRNKASLRG